MVYFVTHSIMYVPRNREICRNNSIGLKLIWFVKAHGELDAFGQRMGPRCLGLSLHNRGGHGCRGQEHGGQ